jgi:two-component system, NarL family, nitrate/nitrite response regulator NarL
MTLPPFLRVNLILGTHFWYEREEQAMIRVLIVDDVRLCQEGITCILKRVEEIAVVDVGAGRGEWPAKVRENCPDIVLLRVDMPDSIGLLRSIVAESPGVKVVVLGVPETEEAIIRCAEAGVAGYLTRDGSLADLMSTLHSIARGEMLCSPRISATLLRRVAALAAERQPWTGSTHLSARERQILHLIDGGLPNKEIAKRLCIDVQTVKNHVHNILEKLRVHRRGEAAARMRGMLLDPYPITP